MAKAALIVRMPGQPDETVELTGPETLIGRAPSCDLQIPDDSMSREHAVVQLDGEEATIEDLQSTNGIKVNGKRVRTHPLSHGDEIEIGQTRLVFTLRE
jgi:pSer/pThr/pTyr-binding forkhead associated (FHA) protein